MNKGRFIAGLTLGALASAAAVVAPAISAQEAAPPHADPRFGTFTPASADPELAAVLAKSGLDTRGFRFTPSESKGKSKRSVTVAVRARTDHGRSETAEHSSATTPDLTLAPIAYDLGVAVGWKRFAVTGDVSKVDLAGTPGSREKAELGVSYTGKKFSGRVKAGADRPLEDTPALVAESPSYSIDVGGSYSIAHNVDLTAGVRYKSRENRLPNIADDDRRDSQAVYVGTAFRF